jgi:hypothetical protein
MDCTFIVHIVHTYNTYIHVSYLFIHERRDAKKRIATKYGERGSECNFSGTRQVALSSEVGSTLQLYRDTHHTTISRRPQKISHRPLRSFLFLVYTYMDVLLNEIVYAAKIPRSKNNVLCIEVRSCRDPSRAHTIFVMTNLGTPRHDDAGQDKNGMKHDCMEYVLHFYIISYVVIDAVSLVLQFVWVSQPIHFAKWQRSRHHR